jgi:hypothetical protein
MSNKKLITEVNDNVEGQGSSVQNINETEFPIQGTQPLPTMPFPGNQQDNKKETEKGKSQR